MNYKRKDQSRFNIMRKYSYFQNEDVILQEKSRSILRKKKVS